MVHLRRTVSLQQRVSPSAQDSAKLDLNIMCTANGREVRVSVKLSVA